MENHVSEPGTEVLFIGGRSGVGKTSAALELHALLAALDVRHAVIEGDNLDLAHPAPWKEPESLRPASWEHGLAAQNLSLMWQNYRTLGYRRLIYTNTVSVRETAELAAAMGGTPKICAVLLGGSDATVQRRLAGRESGPGLREHLRRSREAAAALELHTPAWVHRISTDGRTAADVAGEVLLRTGWAVPVSGLRPSGGF